MTGIITRDELRAGLESGSIIAVDALPESYYAQQHLPHALNLQAADAAADAGALLPDRDAAIVAYCSNPACQNSSQLAAKLQQLGYTNVRKYVGGIEDWVGAGLPTQAGLPVEQQAINS